METTELTNDGLPVLAERINSEHDAAVSAARTGLAHAMEAGRLLTEAKMLCEHGQWQKWLVDNFRGSCRAAQVYMRLYTHRGELVSKTQTPALLTCEVALNMLTTPRSEPLPAFLPPPGNAAEAAVSGKLAYIHPHIAPGYFFCGLADLESGTINFSRRGICAWGVGVAIEMLGVDGDTMCWTILPVEAWEYDQYAYSTAEEAMRDKMAGT